MSASHPYSLELTIDARELAAEAFLAVKRFDSSVVMGTALQQLRECKPFQIPLDRPDVHVWWLYVEVMNGRFDQYFFNSAGDSALFALSALRSVGADDAHAILSDALHQFESVGGFKVDRAERWGCLKALVEGAFDQVTRRFYDLTEDIRSLALMEVERDYERSGITPPSAG